MSTERLKLSRRDSRRVLDEECFSFDEVFERELRSEECFDDEDDLEDDLWEEDSELGTSRMFRMRPVVGSVVEAWAGSWETW